MLEFQIISTLQSENEIFIEWDLNLTSHENHTGFNLTLTYEGPCPNISFISVETVPSTSSSHNFTDLEAYSDYTVRIEPLIDNLSLSEDVQIRTFASGT